MFGIYVHIPFCARRCPYCDFAVHIGARANFVEAYVAALEQELVQALRDPQIAGRKLTSLFFGGGTPTFLPDESLAMLLRLIYENNNVDTDVEITVEANPEDLNPAKLRGLREAGFNRLSLGVQSLDDEALRYLGRVHRAVDVETVVRAAREAGWENVSLDLIYAVPQQSREAWRRTLEFSVQLPVTHVSCYSLTIESETSFGRRAQRGTLLPVCDDAQADQMQDAQDILEAAGILRYETSNYARPGFESKHNRNYWAGGDYLAVGCGAHGHLNGLRWWNERDAAKYRELIELQGNARVGEERLTSRQRLDELVMLGLRTREGFSLQEIARRLDVDAASILNNALERLVQEKWLEEKDGRIRLTARGVPVADAVAVQLLA